MIRRRAVSDEKVSRIGKRTACLTVGITLCRHQGALCSECVITPFAGLSYAPRHLYRPAPPKLAQTLLHQYRSLHILLTLLLAVRLMDQLLLSGGDRESDFLDIWDVFEEK